MKVLLRVVIALMLFPILSSAQGGENIHIQGITLELDQHNQVYYRHVLKPKETLYSLSRYFQIPVEDLLLVNRIAKAEHVSIGTEIIIPIKKSLIRTPIKKLDDSWIPILYTVAKQETLFKISNSYFPQPIQNLITRNNVSSFSLRAGHNLLVGWWGSPQEVEEDIVQRPPSRQSIERSNNNQSTEKPVSHPQAEVVTHNADETTPDSESKKEASVLDLIRNKIIKRGERKQETGTETVYTSPEPEEESKEESKHQPNGMSDYRKSNPQQPVNETDIVAEQPAMDTLFPDLTVIDTVAEDPEPAPIINYQSGIAIWDRHEGDRENLFVMHNDAKPNSYMRLKHPITNKEVTAMVLCPIPKGIHEDHITIILSPAVAIALGALNTEFKIEMDFYQ